MDQKVAKPAEAASGSSDHLVKLGDDVFLLESSEPVKHDPEHPDVIVVFGWMDAEIRHIRKYADQYRKLLSSAKVLVVKSHSNFFWSNSQKKQASVQPAIEYLDSQEITKRDATSNPRTLHLHTFSNGGSVQMTEIAKLLRARRAKHTAPGPSMEHSFPAKSIVIDSAPGGNALRPLLSAFTAPIRSRILKWLTYIPLTLGWLALKAFGTLLRKPSVIDRLHQELVDPTLFPTTAERLYIYSKGDTIIKSQDVERSIATARSAGLTVRTEVYDNSPHVSHARVDGKRYWTAVLDLWKRALQHP
ncbi:hypothetical protein P389DRAFT_194830 [Cystobasidium minutum MCA 4210]|uniref:uncharacterized protein n=1 Tax=Cystobasidium minutum MCA 4210 TaxID=1397322 RepID=UPI0034CDB377|eukprot:jgi/Rhomi1/194830/gm1.3044_g